MPHQISARVPYLLSFVVLATACVGTMHARTTSQPSDTAIAGPPSISIQSPTSGDVVHGVAIIRFLAENATIASPFLPPETSRGLLPSVHLHVTVDGAPWHWVHATADPVVITPLPPGEHTVTIELAGADHRPLDVRSVRFTVVAKPSPAMHHTEHR